MATTKPKHERQLTKLAVAVWWLREGEYGGYREVANWDAAMQECESLEKLGYDKPNVKVNPCEIHIIETRKRLWKFKS